MSIKGRLGRISRRRKRNTYIDENSKMKHPTFEKGA
jgi:hypothetical protein